MHTSTSTLAGQASAEAGFPVNMLYTDAIQYLVSEGPARSGDAAKDRLAVLVPSEECVRETRHDLFSVFPRGPWRVLLIACLGFPPDEN